jgi:hypothetical protein
MHLVHPVGSSSSRSCCRASHSSTGHACVGPLLLLLLLLGRWWQLETNVPHRLLLLL